MADAVKAANSAAVAAEPVRSDFAAIKRQAAGGMGSLLRSTPALAEGDRLKIYSSNTVERFERQNPQSAMILILVAEGAKPAGTIEAPPSIEWALNRLELSYIKKTPQGAMAWPTYVISYSEPLAKEVFRAFTAMQTHDRLYDSARLGLMLGFPECCVEEWIARRDATHKGSHQNFPRKDTFSINVPCKPDCEATARRIEENRKTIERCAPTLYGELAYRAYTVRLAG